MRRVRGSAAFAGASLFIVAGAAFAGRVETSNAGGGTYDPTPTSSVETAWNPDNTCPGYGSLDNQLECLANWIDPSYSCPPPEGETTGNSGGGPGGSVFGQNLEDPDCQNPLLRPEYQVTRIYSPPGLEIVRLIADGGGSIEPYSLLLRENDPNLELAAVEVHRPGLIAKIREIQDQPQGGLIEVRLNGRPITVPTSSNESAWQVTSDLLAAITAAQFTASYEAPYIRVTADSLDSYGLWRVSVGAPPPSVGAPDHGIVSSEIHLEPPVEALVPMEPILLSDDTEPILSDD